MTLRSRFPAVLLALAALGAPAPRLDAQPGAPRPAVAAPAPTPGAPAPVAPEVLLRLDDVGMNHAVNTAVARVAATGLPFSVSVMFACPWYQEAVEILRRHPQVAVGVHLTLNSEWRAYRWGPVLGKAGVPTLVDSAGYFLPSTAAFLARRVDPGEVERELRAQMDRAVASGLPIAYADFHMGTAVATPELRAVLERVARSYGVGISTYFGERYYTLWGVPVASKQDSLLAHLAGADPARPHLVEVHVAERTPEMDVLVDQNAPSQNAADGGPMVARHRAAELEALLSPAFADLVRAGRVRLVTYRDLIARAGGPAAMRPPQ